MAETINTGNGAKKFIKPDYIVVTEYTGEEKMYEEAKGNDYVLEDVVEDTTSISQDDNEKTTIECETSDSPLLEIVKLGKYQFAAEVGDTQTALLRALAGFTKVGTKVIAPSSYSSKYIKVAIVFKAGADKFTAFVVPRVQLNTHLLIESLNSNPARISLAGTARDFDMEIDGKKIRTPFYVEEEYSLGAIGGYAFGSKQSGYYSTLGKWVEDANYEATYYGDQLSHTPDGTTYGFLKENGSYEYIIVGTAGATRKS